MIRKKFVPAFLATLFLVLSPSISLADKQLTVGILAIIPKDEVMKNWQPVMDELSAYSPGYQFVIVPMEHDEMRAALNTARIDFVLTNPSHYIVLKQTSKLSGALTTLITAEKGHNSKALGGVIFTRASQKDINTLKDLRGRKIACIGNQPSLVGGYHAQAYEIFQAGMPLPSASQLLITGVPHDRVVEAVLAGTADVGFVRTGILERLVIQGKLDPSQLKIINQINTPGYPYLVSTQMYPEWPFVALPHVDEELAGRTASILLGLEHGSPIMQRAKIHGFGIPVDYAPVEKMMRELHLPPFDAQPGVTLKDVWGQYAWQIIGLVATSVTIIIMAGRFVLLNRKLQKINASLQLAKDSLSSSEKWHRTVLQTALGGIWTTDLQGNLLEVNQAYCELSGYGSDELQTMCIADVEAVQSKEDVLRHIQEIVRIGEIKFESRHRRKDGSIYEVEISAKYLPVDDGRLVAMITDVTERKQAEEKLLRNKYALEKAQEIGVIGTWELDIVNDKLFWTNENCRIFGVPEDSLVNYHVFITKVHPDDREYVNREWQAAINGKPYDIEHRLLIDGKTRWVREKAHIYFDTNGNAVSAIGVTQDITDRKQLMDDYRRSAQLAALGTVAAGVAHEINNPIQGIINYATLIGNAPDKTERIVDMSGRIIKEGNRIASITRDLLHYAKDNRGEFRVTDILEPIKAATSLASLNYKHSGVSIDLDLPTTPVVVMANPQWIQQVVLNLVENAFDAVLAKGETLDSETITVTGKVVMEGGKDLFNLEVRDNGVGIPEENLCKVRDAFFTTKQETKGTGLGLSIVADIVAKHQGELMIESEEGHYTRVTASLPGLLPEFRAIGSVRFGNPCSINLLS